MKKTSVIALVPGILMILTGVVFPVLILISQFK